VIKNKVGKKQNPCGKANRRIFFGVDKKNLRKGLERRKTSLGILGSLKFLKKKRRGVGM
jgi:hypothetical protein